MTCHVAPDVLHDTSSATSEVLHDVLRSIIAAQVVHFVQGVGHLGPAPGCPWLPCARPTNRDSPGAAPQSARKGIHVKLRLPAIIRKRVAEKVNLVKYVYGFIAVVAALFLMRRHAHQ